MFILCPVPSALLSCFILSASSSLSNRWSLKAVPLLRFSTISKRMRRNAWQGRTFRRLALITRSHTDGDKSLIWAKQSKASRLQLRRRRSWLPTTQQSLQPVRLQRVDIWLGRRDNSFLNRRIFNGCCREPHQNPADPELPRQPHYIMTLKQRGEVTKFYQFLPTQGFYLFIHSFSSFLPLEHLKSTDSEGREDLQTVESTIGVGSQYVLTLGN